MVDALADKIQEPHDNIQTFYEHGQWWVNCLACGAIWAAVDCEGIDDAGNAIALDLERIEQGDESCSD